MSGQSTFNLRDRYDFLACTLTNVIATDSCYYVLGIVADTIFPYNTGAIFMKIGVDGSPIGIKTLKNTEKTYEPWYNGMNALPDGSFVVAGYTVDTAFKAILIKFNQHGDTIFTREYSSPYIPNGQLIVPSGGCRMMSDGGFIISSWVENNLGTDLYLIKTDSFGNKLWGKLYGSWMMDTPQSTIATQNDKIIVGGIRTNENTNVQDYTFQCHIFQVDTAGNQEWYYTSPISAGLRDAANDMLLLDDGSIIVASGIGHEQQRTSVNEVYFDKHVFKLNPQHQVEWELTFPDPELTIQSRTTNLVGLSDGSGYILAGMYYNPEQQPPYNEPTKGWLSKISTSGDSVWTRKYAFLPDYPLTHSIYDMKETPDGGFILCGQSFDWDANANYPQQGWLLKLDEYGCLVPGCQLFDVAGEETEPEVKLAIYPNPAVDYLNFYLKNVSPVKGAAFRIVDVNGRVVKEFWGASVNATFIVPVWEWAGGVYFLQYLEGGEVRCSEKFIKN